MFNIVLRNKAFAEAIVLSGIGAVLLVPPALPKLLPNMDMGDQLKNNLQAIKQRGLALGSLFLVSSLPLHFSSKKNLAVSLFLKLVIVFSFKRLANDLNQDKLSKNLNKQVKWKLWVTNKLVYKFWPEQSGSPYFEVLKEKGQKGLMSLDEGSLYWKGPSGEESLRIRISDLKRFGDSLGINVDNLIVDTLDSKGINLESVSIDEQSNIVDLVLGLINERLYRCVNSAPICVTGSLLQPTEFTFGNGEYSKKYTISKQEIDEGVIDWAMGNSSTSLVLDYAGHNKPGEIEPYRDAMEACYKALSEWEPDFSLDGTVNYQGLLEGMKPFAELFGDRQGIEKLQVGNSQLVQAIYQCLKGLDSSNVSESSVKLQKALEKWGECGGNLNGIRLGKFESYLKASLYGKHKSLQSKAPPFYQAAFEIAKFCEGMFTKLKDDQNIDFENLLLEWAQASSQTLKTFKDGPDAGFIIELMRKFLFVGLSVAPGLAFIKIWPSKTKRGHYDMFFLNMGDGGVVIQKPGEPAECLTRDQGTTSDGPAGVGNVRKALKDSIQVVQDLPPGTVIANFSDGLGNFLSWTEIQEVLADNEFKPTPVNFYNKIRNRKGDLPMMAQNFKKPCKELGQTDSNGFDDIGLVTLVVPLSQESEA